MHDYFERFVKKILNRVALPKERACKVKLILDFCDSTFSNCTFFSVFRALCCALSIQKRTRVSWLFIRHIKEKGGGSQGSRMLESIKRGAEIDSCCDTTIQQATNFGTDASVNQLFARSSMEVVSWQENLPFSSITWLSLFY